VSFAVKNLMIFLRDFAEDIFIFAGLIMIVIATFLLSYVAGLYVTGGILVGFGWFLSRTPPHEGGEKTK
jgi:hypothetical protein